MGEEICENFQREVAEIRTRKVFAQLNDYERAAMLKHLLGPLLEKDCPLSPKEIAYYFLETVLGKSTKKLARSFKCTETNIYAILGSAEKKLKGLKTRRLL